MAADLRVGVVGCGNISAAYLRLSPRFKGFAITACADLNPALAAARAAEFGLTAMDTRQLLASPGIDIVLNLTVPAAHHAVSLAAVRAGKHVYSEKPLATSLADALSLHRAAKAKRVKVACAPDTILGGAHQQARHALDAGTVGKVTSGTAAVLSHGMEAWHPNPGFFFQPGGGPILDMGPYYVAQLINLLGPVKRVAAFATKASKTRTITSQPLAGQTIKVATPTSIQALLEFKSGATITLLASWDVWAHRHGHMELYGSEGTLFLPDPNFFGGPVLATKRDGEAQALPAWPHPLGLINERNGAGDDVANYRSAGLADLARSIHQRNDARCSIDRALHAVEIMTAVLKSGATGKFVTLKTTCTRPAPLAPDDAQALLR